MSGWGHPDLLIYQAFAILKDTLQQTTFLYKTSLYHLYIIASILECRLEDFFEGIEVKNVEWV